MRGTVDGTADEAILIVDDHEPNLVALEVVLGSLDIRIVRATSGEGALREVLTNEFAVIVLDVMMPELDGFETAKLIRGRRRSAATPIIFVTANSLTREDALRGYEVGAADYLMKPFDPTIIRAKVEVFVELHRARKAIERHALALAQSHLEEERATLRANAYRFLAENIPQQVWTARPDGALEYVNPIVLEYFAQPADAILGAGWLNFLHPDDVADSVSRWSVSLASGAPYEIEFRLRHTDGRHRWHLGRATPERDSSGTIIRWLGTNTDIDDRKRVEDELLGAIRSRDSVLATVSHDLRGPLNAVLLASQALQPTPEAVERHRQFISRSVQKMDDLIRDLLDMASIESGHLSVEPMPIIVDDVVAEALEAIQPAAAAKVVSVASEIGAPKVAILGDPGRVLQVFSNILGNAVKFTPSSGKVAVRVAYDNGSHVRFEIADSGPGIEAHELPFVFDRFWQAKASAKAGTGLGLAICKGIVDQHGGSIWVESQIGSGTTFYFTIPLATTG